MVKPYVRAGKSFTSSTSSTSYITTSQDQQTTLKINVFEGPRPLAKHCHYLGTPRGVLEIRVTMHVGNQWDILVTAEHKASETTKFIIIPAEERFNTWEKINRVREEAKYFCRKDKLERSQVVEAIKMCLPHRYITEFGVVHVDDSNEYFGVYHYMDQSGLEEFCKKSWKNTSMIKT